MKVDGVQERGAGKVTGDKVHYDCGRKPRSDAKKASHMSMMDDMLCEVTERL